MIYAKAYKGDLYVFAYSHRNHFVTGFNGVPWQDWQNLDDDFFVRYGRPECPMLPWRTANNLAAGIIANSTAKKVGLAFSGGLDSQCMALAFKDAGVPVVLHHYVTGHPYETKTTREFAKKFDFQVMTHALDVERFFLSGQHEAYNLSSITHGSYRMHCWLMDQIDQCGYLPVFGETCLTRRLGSWSGWGIGEGHTYKATSRYAIIRGLEAVPSFFNYTPEQIHAYAGSEFMKELQAGALTNFAVSRDVIEKRLGRFDGSNIHHVKFILMQEQYPELIHIRKQVGHEHLTGQPWHEQYLGASIMTKEWKQMGYSLKYHKRFEFFTPDGLCDYFTGKVDLHECRLQPERCAYYPNYPE